MLTQPAEILVQLLDPLLVRLDTLLLEALMQLVSLALLNTDPVT